MAGANALVEFPGTASAFDMTCLLAEANLAETKHKDNAQEVKRSSRRSHRASP
jgi:hypothetical protein